DRHMARVRNVLRISHRRTSKSVRDDRAASGGWTGTKSTSAKPSLDDHPSAVSLPWLRRNDHPVWIRDGVASARTTRSRVLEASAKRVVASVDLSDDRHHA